MPSGGDEAYGRSLIAQILGRSPEERAIDDELNRTVMGQPMGHVYTGVDTGDVAEVTVEPIAWNGGSIRRDLDQAREAIMRNSAPPPLRPSDWEYQSQATPFTMILTDDLDEYKRKAAAYDQLTPVQQQNAVSMDQGEYLELMELVSEGRKAELLLRNAGHNGTLSEMAAAATGRPFPQDGITVQVTVTPMPPYRLGLLVSYHKSWFRTEDDSPILPGSILYPGDNARGLWPEWRPVAVAESRIGDNNQVMVREIEY